MSNLGSVFVQAAGAVEQETRHDLHSYGLTQLGPAGHTIAAASAGRSPGKDDMIARLNGGDIVTNLLYNPSAFMAQDRWRWREREIPIYNGQITVTHSACRYFNQNLPLFGPVDLDLFDSQRGVLFIIDCGFYLWILLLLTQWSFCKSVRLRMFCL